MFSWGRKKTKTNNWLIFRQLFFERFLSLNETKKAFAQTCKILQFSYVKYHVFLVKDK